MPSPRPAPTCNMSGRIRRRNFSTWCRATAGPGTIPGTKHVATAFRIDPASGALTPHGGTAPLPSRPVHCSVDRSGEYLLTAYNYPSNITVHRIKPDGTLGEQVPPREKLDVGIFAHQVLTTPGNRTAIMVTRGNNPEANKPEDPGALKVYGFKDGVLSQSRFDPARQRAWLRPAPFRHSSDQAVAVPLGRAPERAARLPTQRRRHAAARRDVHQERACGPRQPRAHARWPAPSTFIRTADSST